MTCRNHISLAFVAGLFVLPLLSAPISTPPRLWKTSSKIYGAVWDSNANALSGSCRLTIGKPNTKGIARLSLAVTPFPVASPYTPVAKTSLKWKVFVPELASTVRMLEFPHPSGQGTIRIYPHEKSFSGIFRINGKDISVGTAYTDDLAQGSCSFSTFDGVALDKFEDGILDYCWKQAPSIPYCMGIWGGMDFTQVGDVFAKSAIDFGAILKPSCPKGTDPDWYIFNVLAKASESKTPNVRRLKFKFYKKNGGLRGKFCVWVDNVCCAAEAPTRAKFVSFSSRFYGVATSANWAEGVVVTPKIKASVPARLNIAR